MGLCLSAGAVLAGITQIQGRIGDDWRQFASVYVRAGRNKSETPDFAIIAERLCGIAMQECALMKELGAWAKRKG